MSKAIALSPKQINKLLSRCELMTHSEMKKCALVLSHAAMRVTEIALIDTKNLLYPSGRIREEIHLPSKICKMLKPRTVWLTNPKSREIIQQGIDFRKRKGWGISPGSSAYQGLNPNSRFIYSNRGGPYAITDKKRELKGGEVELYGACDSLEKVIRQIYKRSGMKGASSHSGRKSLVTNSVIRKGVPLETMAKILGHADPEMALNYLDICQERLEQMCEIAL